MPKWLSHIVPLWQYANMANVQFGYIRCVVDNTQAPNRIRELREAIGLTQADLARLANVTPSALNKVEKGSRGLDQDWMRRLAPHLGVAPADLLPLRDNPDVLAADERRLLDGYRTASHTDRDYFERVTDAIIPWRAQPQEKAA